MGESIFKINQIIGPLQRRIFQIQSKTIDYLAEEYPKHNIDIIVENIFNDDYSTRLKYISFMIDLVEESIELLPEILQDVTFKEQWPTEGGFSSFVSKSSDQVRIETQEKIITELKYYLSALNDIKGRLNIIIDDLDVVFGSATDKIQTNLTVYQIGAIFRLFKDAGLLKDIDKTELSRNISKCFVSKDGGGGSPNVINKAMYPSLDKSDFDFWVNKLPEMQAKAKILAESK